jgi:hypothetical protein
LSKSLTETLSISSCWDSLWNGIAQWFGVTGEDDLNYVLPNHGNFHVGCRLYTDMDLFTNGSNVNEGCGGETLDFEQRLTLSEARYLEDKEQSDYCDLVIEYATTVVGNTTVRCVIIDQKVEEVGVDNDGNPLYELTIVVELSSDKEDFGTKALQVLRENADDIAL